MTLFSKKSLEGELMIDHRASPGISQELAHQLHCLPCPGGMMLETSTVQCNHCQGQVIKNPFRVRDRNYCHGCDRFICDQCELIRRTIGKCIPFEKFAEDYLNKAVKGQLHHG